MVTDLHAKKSGQYLQGFRKKVQKTVWSLKFTKSKARNSTNKRAMMALYRSTGWYVKSIHTKHYITWELV